jgi:hypothetical protein
MLHPPPGIEKLLDSYGEHRRPTAMLGWVNAGLVDERDSRADSKSHLSENRHNRYRASQVGDEGLEMPS